MKQQTTKWTSRLGLARVIIAALALILLLLPGEVWSRPQADLQQGGFDPGLQIVAPENRFLYDPYLILNKGTWEACPCSPGNILTITGSDLAQKSSSSSQGSSKLSGTEVLVDGKPAPIFLVTPFQVDFLLPESVPPGTAEVTVITDGRIRGRDTLAVGPRTDEGAEVALSRETLTIEASPGQEPAIHLLATPLSFRSSFTAVINTQAQGSVPLRLTLWNQRNFSSFDLVFGADRKVQALLLENRGRVARSYDLGSYDLGIPYAISLQWERETSATVSVTGPEGERSASIDSKAAPVLFSAYRPALSALAVAHDGASQAMLTDYQLTLLPERFTTIKADDAKILPLTLTVAVLGVLALLATALRGRMLSPRRWLETATRAGKGLLVRTPKRLALGVSLLTAGYLAFNAFLFSLGSQPFDMGSQQVWAYISAEHGLGDLYYLAQTAPLDVWRGIPYHEAVFPYNLGMAYYFGLIGKFHSLFFGNDSPNSFSLEVTIKAFNLAFMLADAVLVYAIVRRLKPSASLLPWAAAALLLFNPAFVFDTAVWGETESVALFFLLASLLAGVSDRPTLAWSMLAGAFLTKQTILIAVLIIAVYYLLRFDWRRNLEGISSGVIISLLLSLPFVLSGYPPSVLIDPTLAALWVHGGTGAEKVFQVVSYDAFNLWTLVSGLNDGAEGLRRFQSPDYIPSIGGASYHSVGNVLLAG
ncbi:MAG TPA: glycosyltransferase 87 family protein, partial [Dehalococcoidia bacterium]|nr:glycosyltransferase 87 family protein [Dehalococcoidia bacterium]